jgi:hypothetical protein
VNRVVVLLETQLPACVRKGALRVLFRATARAFDRPVPPLAGLSADERLLRYAQFTQGQVTQLLRKGSDLTAVQERLYRNAYALGRACRRVSRICTVGEAMALGKVLYRLLGTEFQGEEGGDVVISRCYFSGFYSGQVCQVMSAMDRGLFAGLSDGRELVFFERITEGRARCRAHLNG